MYYVNKIVGWLLSPLGIVFIGLAVGFALWRIVAQWKHCDQSRWSQIARLIGAWLICLSIVFLWLMSCGVTTRIIGIGLERPWEREGTMHCSIEGLPDADVIVILGGGVGAHEKCHAPELYSGADRVWQGARLYKVMSPRTKGLRVFCTGGGCEYAAVPFLTDLGVPREAIWFSEEPRNTEEEARLIKSTISADVVNATNIKPRIYLVTSAWHMSRAKILFGRVGFDIIPVPTDFEMSCAAERNLEFGDFFPSADALYRNSCAVKEWVARLGYALLRR